MREAHESIYQNRKAYKRSILTHQTYRSIYSDLRRHGHIGRRSGSGRLFEVVRLSRAHEEASPSARIATSRLGLGFCYPCRICCQLRSLEQTVAKPKITMCWVDRFRIVARRTMNVSLRDYRFCSSGWKPRMRICGQFRNFPMKSLV